MSVVKHTLAALKQCAPDSACISIWSHLSSISKTFSIHIQWIPAHIGMPGNTLADSKAKQGSTLPQFLSIWQQQRSWFWGRVRRSSMPATYVTRTRPHIAFSLERPIRRHTGDLAGPEASVSPLLSWEQVTVHFWPATFTVLDDNSLQRVHTAEATTRWRSIFYFAVCHTRRHDHLLAASTQLILDAYGPFWSRPQLWHAPRPGMRERERQCAPQIHLLTLTYILTYKLTCVKDDRQRFCTF